MKNKINEDNLSQRIRFKFPKHEIIDQLENMFVFNLETYNDQAFAEAYAAGLYGVNRLRDRWDREKNSEEIQTQRKYVVSNKSCGNPVMNMLKFFSPKTTKVIKELLSIKVMKSLAGIVFFY